MPAPKKRLFLALIQTIEHLETRVFKLPTDFPESDGTLEWDSTTLILVKLRAGNISGFGYTYGHECGAPLIREKLFPVVRNSDPMNIGEIWEKMNASVRNLGKRGIAATAIGAVDVALWDLKARLLDLPLVKLLGPVREKIPVYGSGGFTSYSEQILCQQLGNWADEGISMVKMKVGRQPADDPIRVGWARTAVGDTVSLFVDANGAYSPKQALMLAEKFSEQKVSWFEEPVSSNDLAGLRFVREHSPLTMEISAGEYNFDLLQARQMLEAQAVDVLQADATRCGVTGFLQMADLCEAFGTPLSSHTAPALHAHLCCVAPRARHAEYFHDHVRIEQLFFDGATSRHKNGFLQPDLSQPGLGLEFKAKDAAKFEIDR
jgi:L-alanine-DL-glutamate epimerase-like enolase superfamily enzyme